MKHHHNTYAVSASWNIPANSLAMIAFLSSRFYPYSLRWQTLQWAAAPLNRHVKRNAWYVVSYSQNQNKHALTTYQVPIPCKINRPSHIGEPGADVQIVQ